MNGSSAGGVRLSRQGVGAELSVPRGLREGGSMMRDATTGVIYATADAWELTSGRDRGTALIRLLPPDMTVDPAWTTFAGERGRQFYGFAYQTDTHVYACRAAISSEVRRFDKLTGREDPDWRSDETYLCNAAFERGTDGSTTVFSSSSTTNEPQNASL